MNLFGKCAILATKKMADMSCNNPAEAWELSISELSKSPNTQAKGCPRNAFLGLCEEGLIRGIESGKYANLRENKEYVLTVVKVLAQTSKPFTASQLWRHIGNEGKQEGQMDVVLSLWKNDLIDKEKVKGEWNNGGH